MGGKYSVGYHGPQIGRDLQGIATLTHDPIAIDNRHEQSGQVVDELDRARKDAAVGIREVKRKILDAIGISKDAFEK